MYKLEIKTVESLKNKFHPIAEMNPYQDENQQRALSLDIEANGQIVPIFLYRGKIVDGRHRWLALNGLGIKDIKCNIIPQNRTLDEVRSIVMSTENRRHSDRTNRAIQAYRVYKEEGGSQKDIADKFGVNRQDISNCITIDKYFHDYTQLLFEGNKYKLESGKPTRNLKAIADDLREKHKKANNIVTPEDEIMDKTYKYFLRLSPAMQSLFVERQKREGYLDE